MKRSTILTGMALALSLVAGTAQAAPLKVQGGTLVLPTSGIAITVADDPARDYMLSGSWALTEEGTFDSRDVVDELDAKSGNLVRGNWILTGYFGAGNCDKKRPGREGVRAVAAGRVPPRQPRRAGDRGVEGGVAAQAAGGEGALRGGGEQPALGAAGERGVQLPLGAGAVFGAFRSALGAGIAAGSWRSAERVTRTVQRHWGSFAMSHAPVAGWPKYTTNQRRVLVIDERPHVRTDPGGERRQAWQKAHAARVS